MSSISYSVFGTPTPPRSWSPGYQMPPSPLRSSSTTPPGDSPSEHASLIPREDSSSSSPSSSTSSPIRTSPTIGYKLTWKAIDILEAHRVFFKSNEDKFTDEALKLKAKSHVTMIEQVNKLVNAQAALYFKDLKLSCTSSMNLLRASEGYLAMERCIAPVREQINLCRLIAQQPRLKKDQTCTPVELINSHQAHIAGRIVEIGDKLISSLLACEQSPNSPC